MKITTLTTLLAFAAIVLLAGCNSDDDSGTDPIINPSVEATSPGHDVDNVSLDKVISVGFNQEMDATTFNDDTFVSMQGSTPIEGTVSYADLTATFTPNVALTENTTYTATISDTVKSMSGVAI